MGTKTADGRTAKKTPCLSVIKEMQELMQELEIHIVHAGDKYRAWKNQMQIKETAATKERGGLPLSKSNAIIDKHKIPLSMIDYFKRIAKTVKGIEPWERALEYTQLQETILEKTCHKC